MTEVKNEIAEKKEEQQLPMSRRFTEKIMQEFTGNVGDHIQITENQKALIQGYFISIDRTLKTTEESRIRKNSSNKDHKYDNTLPCTWNNINLDDLALDLVHYAKMGLDMMQDNHLFPIPYKNNKTGKYDITLMPGYNGIRYIAEKYAVEKPKDVTTEIVYSTDKFHPIKKDRGNSVESYEFEITNPFDRGEIIGGFGYIQYDDPQKNKLIIMSMKDIEKRKPAYAAAEFWGGKTTRYENGKKVDVELDGWLEEMCLKTIKREVYSSKHIPRDPEKVDEHYQHMKESELRYVEMQAEAEIQENANRVLIDAEVVELTEPSDEIKVDYSTGEIVGEGQPKENLFPEEMEPDF